MWNIGWQELLVIGIVALIFFGGRLPEAAKNLARAFVQFKRELNSATSTPNDPPAQNAEPKQAQAEAPPAPKTDTPPQA